MGAVFDFQCCEYFVEGAHSHKHVTGFSLFKSGCDFFKHSYIYVCICWAKDIRIIYKTAMGYEVYNVSVIIAQAFLEKRTIVVQKDNVVLPGMDGLILKMIFCLSFQHNNNGIIPGKSILVVVAIFTDIYS